MRLLVRTHRVDERRRRSRDRRRGKNGSVLQSRQQAAASEKVEWFCAGGTLVSVQRRAGFFRRPINTAWAVLKLGHCPILAKPPWAVLPTQAGGEGGRGFASNPIPKPIRNLFGAYSRPDPWCLPDCCRMLAAEKPAVTSCARGCGHFGWESRLWPQTWPRNHHERI